MTILNQRRYGRYVPALTDLQCSLDHSMIVLPNICVLCQKEKTITCRITRKRKKEHLVKCSTIYAVNLKQGAEDNKNETLLLQIKDKDCVAIEVRYHNSCYKDYTRYLTKPQSDDTSKNDTSYSVAFEVFCEKVKSSIIENKDIMRLKTLNDMFIKQVKLTHGKEADSYKTGNLKTRLMKKFPQLCFITPRMRSQSEIVYVNDISTAALVEDKELLQDAMQITADREEDSTNEIVKAPTPSKQSNIFDAQTNKLKDSYMTAFELRNIINDVKPTMPWPPTSEHLNKKTAETLVPCSLYNFIAWTVGASEEPDFEKFVQVTPSTHKKLLSISQDIISLVSNGRKLMPKHMSLAMAIRHLSGSAQLIGLLNGFGHCVSHSVTLNHDTALANQEVRRGVDALPLSIQPRIRTIIVWDNNDFGEETLSGHETTHNTNGIVIQHGNTTASTTDPPNASKTDPPNASTTDLPNASTTDPPNASTTDLPNASTTDPPNASTTDPPNASTTDPPKASTTDPANASTTDPANASTTDPPNASTTDVLEKRTRKRSMEPPLANLATYYGGGETKVLHHLQQGFHWSSQHMHRY